MKEKAALPYSPVLYEQNLSVQRIYLVEPGQGEARELTVDGHFSALEWSPDGKKLICASAPTSLVDDSYMSVTLSIVDVATMKVLSTIDHQGKKGDAQWS